MIAMVLAEQAFYRYLELSSEIKGLNMSELPDFIKVTSSFAAARLAVRGKPE